MFKGTRFKILLSVSIIAICLVIVINSFEVLHAEVATGVRRDSINDKYWITTGTSGENIILCSKELYDKYGGDIDFGSTTTLFIVIYESKLLMPSQKKVIQVMKYKEDWDDEIHSRIIPNKTYYRLVQEDMTSIDNTTSILTRVYECYRPENSQMLLVADSFVTPYFDNINSMKEWMKKKNNNLQLRPLTIVSESVLNKWKDEDYMPTFEYTINSPQGLTYENLMN